jgi:inhibitor of cysteine peptidase
MKRYFLPFLAAALLALSGCETVTEAPASGQTVSLGIEQAGGSFQVHAGDTIVINLAANPSTGASWEFIDLNRDIFSEEKTPKAKRTEAPLPGEGGKITFTLRARKPGTATIKMLYHRPWETNNPWGKFDATITVLP